MNGEERPTPNGWTTAIAVADQLAKGLSEVRPPTFPEPEDRGQAKLTDLGHVQYVDDLIPAGRIIVIAAQEGTGKSMATNELGIRVAVAGGSFAGTWPVLQRGNVLVLSEMHTDDDWQREEAILAALGHERADLTGRYFRLPLMTAANGPPPLMVDTWRTWVTAWMRSNKVVLSIIDTGTGATQVDPWGRAIQEVYAHLRMMLAEYPALSIVIVVHLRKGGPGRTDENLDKVIGEWGRWCDGILVMKADGPDRLRLSTHKRFHNPRAVLVTKRGGLLVEPVALDGAKALKVPTDRQLAAIQAHPGSTYLELAKALGVGKATAERYVAELVDQGLAVASREGDSGPFRVHATTPPPHATPGGD